jgi:hypothetical protein
MGLDKNVPRHGKPADNSFIEALYDTGACTSIMSEASFRRFQSHKLVRDRILTSESNARIHTADGTQLDTIGIYRVQFYFKGQSKLGVFFIAKQLTSDCIIGMNIIAKEGLFFNPLSNSVDVHGSDAQSISALDHGRIGLQDFHPGTDEDGNTNPSPIEIRCATTVDCPTGMKCAVKCYLFDSRTQSRISDPSSFIAETGYGGAGLCSSGSGGYFNLHIGAMHKKMLFKRDQQLGLAYPTEAYTVLSGADAQ